jgi:hypothetical protein
VYVPHAPFCFLPLTISVQLYPDGDFSQDMELDGWVRSFQPESTTTEEPSLIADSASPSIDESSSYPSPPAPEESESYSEDSEADAKDGSDELLGSLRRLCIKPSPRRYFGKSSGIELLRAAITIKSKSSNGESTGLEPETHTQRRPEFWRLHPVSLHQLFSSHRVHLIEQSSSLVGTWPLPIC